jgi:uncharacterized membrane protein YedE/YeeE
MARSGCGISATFASRAFSPSALRASAFSSWARSLIAARSSAVNPWDFLADFVVPFFAGFFSAICESTSVRRTSPSRLTSWEDNGRPSRETELASEPDASGRCTARVPS